VASQVLHSFPTRRSSDLFGLTASQILASGTIISALVGLDLSVAIIFAAFIVIVYTVMGGLFADALSDLIQWFVISFGLLVAVPRSEEHTSELQSRENLVC